jgi:hypothetical protein
LVLKEVYSIRNCGRDAAVVRFIDGEHEYRSYLEGPVARAFEATPDASGAQERKDRVLALRR